MKTLTRYCATIALLGCFALLGSNVAEASHFRGGYITYEPTGTPGEVQINAVSYWRRSFYGAPNVGDVINVATFTFGDGTSAPGGWTVTQINPAADQDWIVVTKTMVHTYADPNGTYTAGFSGCCRIGSGAGGLGNRANDGYTLVASITPTNDSPTTSSGPFVGVARSTSTTYSVPVVVDGDPFTCRFATDAEAGGGPNPPGMTINSSTCLITWDNNALPSRYYTTQVIIEERDAQGNVKGTVPLDILFEIGAQGVVNTAPVCTITPGTPAGGGTTDVSATINVPLNFTVTGTDADMPAQTLGLAATLLPAGATGSPALPISGTSPISTTISYTPTALGVQLATFSVSDGFTSALCTARINVRPAQQNACQDPATAPSYAGGFELNMAGTRAFIKVMAPQGGSIFEFYNMTNLVVGDPEMDKESGMVLAGLVRAGDTFIFGAGDEPTEAFFPVTTADPADSRVAFFLRVTDTCQRVVDVDPEFTLTGVAEQQMEGFALAPAQPNPSTGQATLYFSLDAPGAARLALYDVLGREVAVVVDGSLSEGSHEARFDGSSLPAGLYVYRLEAGGRTLQRMLTLAR